MTTSGKRANRLLGQAPPTLRQGRRAASRPDRGAHQLPSSAPRSTRRSGQVPAGTPTAGTLQHLYSRDGGQTTTTEAQPLGHLHGVQDSTSRPEEQDPTAFKPKTKKNEGGDGRQKGSRRPTRDRPTPARLLPGHEGRRTRPPGRQYRRAVLPNGPPEQGKHITSTDEYMTGAGNRVSRDAEAVAASRRRDAPTGRANGGKPNRFHLPTRRGRPQRARRAPPRSSPPSPSPGSSASSRSQLPPDRRSGTQGTRIAGPNRRPAPN